MSGENETSTARWLQQLPLRWAGGGLILGVAWLLLSSALGSFQSPEGGLTAAFFRVGLIVLLPLMVLGLIWGHTERLKIAQSIGQGRDVLSSVIRGTMKRQLGKAALCGLSFGLYVRVIFLFGGGAAFENVGDEFVRVLASMLLALPVGFAVGHFFRRDLDRRFGDVVSS